MLIARGGEEAAHVRRLTLAEKKNRQRGEQFRESKGKTTKARLQPREGLFSLFRLL